MSKRFKTHHVKSQSCDILVLLQASDEEQCAALKQMNFVPESQGEALSC